MKAGSVTCLVSSLLAMLMKIHLVDCGAVLGLVCVLLICPETGKQLMKQKFNSECLI